MAKKAAFGGKSEDPRKAAAPKPKKSSLKISAKRPALDSMSVGAAMAPMDQAAGLRPGMKKGGCAMKGYFKGGSVDGAIKKGHTKGKIC